MTDIESARPEIIVLHRPARRIERIGRFLGRVAEYVYSHAVYPALDEDFWSWTFVPDYGFRPEYEEAAREL